MTEQDQRLHTLDTLKQSWTDPIEPWPLFCFMEHVFPAKIRVGHSALLRDAYAEVGEMHDAANQLRDGGRRRERHVSRENGYLKHDSRGYRCDSVKTKTKSKTKT